MNNKKIAFRKASDSEINVIFSNIKKHFGEEAVCVLQKHCLWVKDGSIREVFALKPSIEKIVESLSHYTYFAGIPIGTLKDGNFQLEIEGSILIRTVTKKVLQVKTNQFLYGKAIFTENILDFESNFQRGDLIIIEGKNHIHYGLGEADLGSDEISKAPSNTVVVYGYKNVPRDRGWYLRKGN